VKTKCHAPHMASPLGAINSANIQNCSARHTFGPCIAQRLPGQRLPGQRLPGQRLTGAAFQVTRPAPRRSARLRAGAYRCARLKSQSQARQIRPRTGRSTWPAGFALETARDNGVLQTARYSTAFPRPKFFRPRSYSKNLARPKRRLLRHSRRVLGNSALLRDLCRIVSMTRLLLRGRRVFANSPVLQAVNRV
jgi:hypothetical protein